MYPHSMRCSLNLQLRSAHEKPQQPNRFDFPTDPGQTQTWLMKLWNLNFQFFLLFSTWYATDTSHSPGANPNSPLRKNSQQVLVRPRPHKLCERMMWWKTSKKGRGLGHFQATTNQVQSWLEHDSSLYFRFEDSKLVQRLSFLYFDSLLSLNLL